MLGLKRLFEKETIPERFSEDEAMAVFNAITPQDIKILKTLERRMPAEATFIAARAEMAISLAADSLTRLGNLGLLSTTEFKDNSLFVEVDNIALGEVVQKVSLHIPTTA